jgi:hypothetical protein
MRPNLLGKVSRYLTGISSPGSEVEARLRKNISTFRPYLKEKTHNHWKISWLLLFKEMFAV